MTIGIAATGPWAGAGVLAGLRAVEAVGRGAIKGFVSLAVLTESQELLRAETQDGGIKGLFADQPPDRILSAPYAALISSGPNRPTPLSQFVAAAPGVGLVTGHRFPHMAAKDGKPLNTNVLASMGSGLSAQKAVDDVIAANPGADAGFVALSTKGDIGWGNMPSVLRRFDHGAATRHCNEMGAVVTALHNAIHPHRAIALLTSEVALDEMRLRETTIRTITVSSGVELSLGERPEIHVDNASHATRILHPEAQMLAKETSFGMGDRVRVVQVGETLGWLGHEPFMVTRNGSIFTLDGETEVKLPVHIRNVSTHNS
ncbi:MAG: hypothetical protein AAFR68_17445 [Pseudomonadota bacterium]